MVSTDILDIKVVWKVILFSLGNILYLDLNKLFMSLLYSPRQFLEKMDSV